MSEAQLNRGAVETGRKKETMETQYLGYPLVN